MGHYREGRPQPWEDRMKGVEVCYSTVKKINKAPFSGFTVWEKGKHIIPPARRRELALIKSMALNRGYKPRLGMSMEEDVNHTRMVKAMVGRILCQNDSWQRRRNPHNVDMHPAFLRRPLEKPSPRPPPKKKMGWVKSTLTNGQHTPYLTAEERYRRFQNRVRSPDIPVRKFTDRNPLNIREGTPFYMTSRPRTKLIDATHGLANRRLFDFTKSSFKSTSNESTDYITRIGSNDKEMTQTYSKVLSVTDAVSFYTPCPHFKKKKTDIGWHRNWFYDMDNKDLPSDLKITPSDHAIDNPIRPIADQKAHLNPFTEPTVLYDVDHDMTPLAHPPSVVSSPSTFGMHAYGSRPGWAPPHPGAFLDKFYEYDDSMMSPAGIHPSSAPGSSVSESSSARSQYNEETEPMTPVPPNNSGVSSPFYAYDPAATRNLAPNYISPWYSFDRTNFRNGEGGISRPNSREGGPSSKAALQSLPPSPGYLTPRSNIFKPWLLGEDVDWNLPDYQKAPYRPLDDPPWKFHQCCETP